MKKVSLKRSKKIFSNIFRNLRRKKGRAPMKFELLYKKSPFIYKESYKSVRTNLDFTLPDSRCKKIVVTSASPQEGKSSFIINLATSLAENGLQVLLMDCDLRKPVLHKYLNLRKGITGGITSAIKSPDSVDEFIYHHPTLSFDVIFAGKIPPNPSELLGSANMEKIVNDLSSRYDYILCDAPPSSLMSDAPILSRYMDGVILVVKHKFSTFEQVKRTKKNLESVNANILGVVLNHYDISEKSTSNSSYYGSSYGYSYSQETYD